MSERKGISGLLKEELAQELGELGEKAFRTNQIRGWLFKKLVGSFDEMANLPRGLRGLLGSLYDLTTLSLERIQESQDGTKKFLYRLKDGLFIESVLIPEKDHTTLCVSSQVGCQMGCAFCLTGRRSFRRNLLAWEIVDQVLEARRREEGRLPITNIVFMGMGEPLMNLKEVLRAISIIMEPEGLAFSQRRVTVSTSGIVPGILALGKTIGVNLAVSLNAPNDRIRDKLMPINQKYPLKELMSALRNYPLKKGRRITFEYVLVSGLNDGKEHALELAALLKGIPSKINLIPLNPFPGCGLQRPTEGVVMAFQEVLLSKGITAIIRKSKGQDIMAACGQLAGGAPVGPGADTRSCS